jgi:fermentation-respiration switch protein FrsA (DUF1100 family)
MTLIKIAIGLTVAFGGFVLLMYLAQRSLMYFPDGQRTAPAAAGVPAAEEIVLSTADGEKVILWHVAPREGRPVIVYFHGNGGALRHRADRFRRLTADGTGLVALSYRGYGGSTGSPTESGLLADAAAAFAFTVARYPTERIVVWGESLGSGVAVAIAATHPVACVVLESPFTSAADVASGVYWFLPVRLLMKDQFRSDQRIGKVSAPFLLMHGERDQVVPVALGRRLFELGNEPKRFLRFPAGGHVDLDRYGAIEQARAFIDGTMR